jgi:hypothetical protein
MTYINRFDVTIAKGNLMNIDNTFLRSDRLAYLTTLGSVLPKENNRKRALYLLSGGDFISSYILSNGADEIILVDRLPFEGEQLSEEDYNKHKEDYYYKKYNLNFSVEPDLLYSIGCLQYILWELEAMGVDNIESVINSVKIDKESQQYSFNYQLPDQASKKIIYYIVEDAQIFSSYPQKLIEDIELGIDCLIRKAAVKVNLDKNILHCIAKSMNQHSLMFIDDESYRMLDDVAFNCCPINETFMQQVRELENRSMLFGYNPVTVYQKKSDRIESEIQQRFVTHQLPNRIFLLLDNPIVDISYFKTILEYTDIEIIIISETENNQLAELKDVYFPQFTVEKTLSETDIEACYINNPEEIVYIIGDEDKAENFKDYQSIHYYVANSSHYPYLNISTNVVLCLALCNEENISEYERFFQKSFNSNRYRIQFDLFKRIDQKNVIEVMSCMADIIKSRLSF